MRTSKPRAAAGIAVVLSAALFAAAPGRASTPTSVECAEGAEFIGNAAHARENGMSREAFLGRMQADFQTIRAFPNELRGFVHDEADERFLVGAARDVFDRPETPRASPRVVLSRLPRSHDGVSAAEAALVLWPPGSLGHPVR